MLRTLGPEDPIVQGRVLIIGALFFIICGLNYKRIADYIQRRSGHSDKMKQVGLFVMKPMLFIMAAFTLLLAFMFLTGRA